MPPGTCGREMFPYECYSRQFPLSPSDSPFRQNAETRNIFRNHFQLISLTSASFPRAPASELIRPESRIEPQSPTVPVQRLLLALADGAMAPSALWERLGLKHRPTFRENYLHPALSQGLIERTIPDKSNSRLQQYRLTPKGRARLS